jgi:hypothetical protein
MKKIKYHIGFILLNMISCSLLQAQVGINTNNPQGVFHIDTKGNNPSIGIPSAAEMADDVIVDKNTVSGVNVSIGGKVPNNSSAQLSLLDPNKAILLNRVALTGLRDITTIPNPPAGMLVYNTATAGTYPNNITPGYYYFDGAVWYKWMYGEVGSELSQHDLIGTCSSTSVASLNAAGAATTAALADFGTIKIKEKGVYIFSLRLYGVAIANGAGTFPPVFYRGIFYLYMMKNGSTKLDAIEINVPYSGGSGASAHTATVTLQSLLNTDDVVTFRLAHYSSGYGWSLWSNGGGLIANKTSLIYWKI